VDDITGFFDGTDAFIYPSLREGSPNALLEAMAHCKLCLVSDIPEHREALGHVPEECFFRPHDDHDLLAKMKYWMGHPERMNAVAAANRRRIEDKHSIRSWIAAHEELYSDLVRASGRGRPKDSAKGQPGADSVPPTRTQVDELAAADRSTRALRNRRHRLALRLAIGLKSEAWSISTATSWKPGATS
jgi:hypothetical protein